MERTRKTCFFDECHVPYPACAALHHIRQHLSFNPFRCSCGTSYYDANALDVHIEKVNMTHCAEPMTPADSYMENLVMRVSQDLRDYIRGISVEQLADTLGNPSAAPTPSTSTASSSERVQSKEIVAKELAQTPKSRTPGEKLIPARQKAQTEANRTSFPVHEQQTTGQKTAHSPSSSKTKQRTTSINNQANKVPASLTNKSQYQSVSESSGHQSASSSSKSLGSKHIIFESDSSGPDSPPDIQNVTSSTDTTTTQKLSTNTTTAQESSPSVARVVEIKSEIDNPSTSSNELFSLYPAKLFSRIPPELTNAAPVKCAMCVTNVLIEKDFLSRYKHVSKIHMKNYKGPKRTTDQFRHEAQVKMLKCFPSEPSQVFQCAVCNNLDVYNTKEERISHLKRIHWRDDMALPCPNDRCRELSFDSPLLLQQHFDKFHSGNDIIKFAISLFKQNYNRNVQLLEKQYFPLAYLKRNPKPKTTAKHKAAVKSKVPTKKKTATPKR